VDSGDARRGGNLVTDATAMGLREFDANLVIAIVQDAARNGEAALGSQAHSRLGLVQESRGRDGHTPLLVTVLTVGLGVLIFGLLVSWMVA
jgi:hypothetical protein